MVGGVTALLIPGVCFAMNFRRKEATSGLRSGGRLVSLLLKVPALCQGRRELEVHRVNLKRLRCRLKGGQTLYTYIRFSGWDKWAGRVGVYRMVYTWGDPPIAPIGLLGHWGVSYKLYGK